MLGHNLPNHGLTDFNPGSIFSHEVEPLLSPNRGYQIVKGNLVHETAVVNWRSLSIGTHNIIGPYVCLGEDAENISVKSDGIIKIGSGNVFKEHSTVNLPTNPSLNTIIGDRNYFMAHAHIAHDCVLEDNIVMCNQSSLGGHVRVMNGAILALNSSVHQFQVIGSWSMIGMNCCVTKTTKILPGYTYVGVPARRLRLNKIGLERNKVDIVQLKLETKRFLSLKKEVA